MMMMLLTEHSEHQASRKEFIVNSKIGTEEKPTNLLQKP
jgi:hypothetical protein